MSAMNAAACVAEAPVATEALIGTADPLVVQRVPLELERLGRRAPSIASTFAHLRQRFVRETPAVLVIDESLLRNAPLAASLRQFESAGPVILLASLAASAKPSYWSPKAKSSLWFAKATFRRWPPDSSSGACAPQPLRREESSGPAYDEWREIGEVFRHEINNPLTGILGNSEMLLAHREHLTPADTQRLETVVDLAVRLRETIRRLSSSLESSDRSLKPV